MNDFLEENAPELITKYELESFEVNVLDYRRTFCEKISEVARSLSDSSD